ncbi:MAG: hypothetical protein IJR14_09935 [Synergistaceae bacterium]|nr:hypothetical protein [Synergistaceae bacterium]
MTKEMTLVVGKADGPAAPSASDLVLVPPSARGRTDGMIMGVDATMEWRADSGKTWTTCPATGTITGSSAGSYRIRYAETDDAGPASRSS